MKPSERIEDIMWERGERHGFRKGIDDLPESIIRSAIVQYLDEQFQKNEKKISGLKKEIEKNGS